MKSTVADIAGTLHSKVKCHKASTRGWTALLDGTVAFVALKIISGIRLLKDIAARNETKILIL